MVYPISINPFTFFTNFGIFVTINEVIEGLISYEDMPDFEYDAEPNLGFVKCYPSKTIYRIGEKVQVRVICVNVKKKEVTFKLNKSGGKRMKTLPSVFYEKSRKLNHMCRDLIF